MLKKKWNKNVTRLTKSNNENEFKSNFIFSSFEQGGILNAIEWVTL